MRIAPLAVNHRSVAASSVCLLTDFLETHKTYLFQLQFIAPRCTVLQWRRYALFKLLRYYYYYYYYY